MWMALILSIIVTFVAISGLLCKCVKNRILTCTYGTCLLPIFVTLIVVGLVFLFSSEVIIENIVTECAKNGISLPLAESDEIKVTITAEGT